MRREEVRDFNYNAEPRLHHFQPFPSSAAYHSVATTGITTLVGAVAGLHISSLMLASLLTIPKEAAADPKTKGERNQIAHTRICCYMAKREFGSDVSEDLTRESLIALSYTLPDTKNLSSKEVDLKNVAEDVNSDENEKVRAGLISISYAESPDTKDSPVSPEKNKG
ncbi:hypothetical protein LXL04_010511 [Taraxacum kok-saghyz]